MWTLYGEIRGGAVILPPNCPLPDGQRVRVEPVEEPCGAEAVADGPLPLHTSHPACGMWADRADLADSVAYSRCVRQGLSTRH
ncbi:hypothetical protein FJY63_02985 [Candidatus Sumerlaeota bacterium]|nr:hypothetical protein [Candidatus Sumerlaeota bacterium]